MRRQKYLYLFALFLFLVSCKKDFFDSVVEVEIPAHTPQLTIAAHFNELFDGSSASVGHSVDILDSTSNKVVTDAFVELLADKQVIEDSFELWITPNGKTSFYAINKKIEFSRDKTYTLKVSSPEYGQVSATQTLPTKVLIENATYEENGAIDRWGDRGDAISVQFTDPPNEQNYYEFRVDWDVFVTTKDSSFAVQNLYTWSTPIDPLLEDIGNRLLLSDAGFDGTTYTVQLATFLSERLRRSQMNNRWGDNAEVELTAVNVYLLSVSKDYYIFHKSFANYRDNQGNFFAEPSNVYENIEGGIGIFTLSTGDIFKIDI